MAAKRKSTATNIIDGVVIICDTTSTLLKNSKKLVAIIEKLKKPP